MADGKIGITAENYKQLVIRKQYSVTNSPEKNTLVSKNTALYKLKSTGQLSIKRSYISHIKLPSLLFFDIAVHVEITLSPVYSEY